MTVTRPVAVAVRAVTSLAETSTIRAAPDSSTCVSRAWSEPCGGFPVPSTSEVPVQHEHLHLRPGSIRVTSSGTTISALASARSPTRCEPCPPTGATWAPRPSISNSPRTNCRFPGAEEKPWEVIARTSGRRYGSRPIIRRIAGTTKTSKETYDDTGLPGSVKIGVASSPTTPKPCGLPGCMATSPNSTVPSSTRASFTTSYWPLLTPPLVTTRSARTSWSLSAWLNSSGSSETIPTR